MTNTYNGDGLRVKKVSGSSTSQYVYEYDKVILELDGSGNQKAANVYGKKLLSRVESGTPSYYLYNGHGDVTTILNASGTVIAGYYYDAFGVQLDVSGSVSNPYRYSGYVYDEETNLYYLNARFYSAETARFLQEDSYRGNIGDPLSLNLYSYVSYNPLIYTDPTGHYVEYSGYHISVQDHLAIHRANEAYIAAEKIANSSNSTDPQKKQAEADMKAATATVDVILSKYTKATNDVSGSKSTEVTSPDVVEKIAEDVISSNAPEVVKALADTYVDEYTAAYKIYRDSVSSSSSKAQAKADMDAILAKINVVHETYVGVIGERIVVSGGSDGNETFKYNFIETAIKQILDWKSISNDSITWIIAYWNYSRDDLANFKSVGDIHKVNVMTITHKQELFDYINKDGREDTPITAMSFFAHGTAFDVVGHDNPGHNNEYAIALGYTGIGNNHNNDLNIFISDLSKINSSSFATDCYTFFGSCRTGNEFNGVVFAQEWADLTGGNVKAATGTNGRTWYGDIFPDDRSFWTKVAVKIGWSDEKASREIAREQYGFSITGSLYYPDLTKFSSWKMFYAR